MLLRTPKLMTRGVAALVVVASAYLSAYLPAAFAAQRAAATATTTSELCDRPRLFRCGGRTIVETRNLRICGLGAGPANLRWASEIERLRTSLSEKWLGDRRPADWSPKCELAIHATAAGYAKAVGSDHAFTAGCSNVETASGRIARRRIDIRADRPGWLSGALAHELTHVVLADEFIAAGVPLWADEGMAVLADPAAKQGLHLRDFDAARQCGRTLRLAELLAESGVPSREQMPAFYGQSLSLAKYLIERKTPADFVSFLHSAQRVGYDAALRDCYGLGGVADLERQWGQASSITTAERAPRELGQTRGLVLRVALAQQR